MKDKYPTNTPPAQTAQERRSAHSNLIVRVVRDSTPEEVGDPSVEEWADWIVSRYHFCERNAGESLREICLVALRNVANSKKRGTNELNEGTSLGPEFFDTAE
jgi:hypothetical protein